MLQCLNMEAGPEATSISTQGAPSTAQKGKTQNASGREKSEGSLTDGYSDREGFDTTKADLDNLENSTKLRDNDGKNNSDETGHSRAASVASADSIPVDGAVPRRAKTPADSQGAPPPSFYNPSSVMSPHSQSLPASNLPYDQLLNSAAGTSRVSLEDLHRGKAFSFTHFLKRMADAASLSVFSNDSSGSAANPSNSSPALAGDASRAFTRNGVPVKSKNGDPLSMMDSSGPDRIAEYGSSREGGEVGASFQTTPKSMKSKIAQQSPSSHLLRPDFTSLIAKDPRIFEKFYYHAEMQFMASLYGISDRLLNMPKEARQSSLVAEITMLNHNFPAPVCIPLFCHPSPGHSCMHHIVRICPTDCIVLDSAERVPFLIHVEVSLQSSSNRRGHQVLKMPNSSADKENHSENSLNDDSADEARAPHGDEYFEMEHSSRRNSSGTPLNRSISKRPINPGFSRSPLRTSSFQNISATSELEMSTEDFAEEREFAELMRTAAIMLAQLFLQDKQQNDNPAQKVPARSTKKRRALPKLNEEIRTRIIKEMMALEEKRMHKLSKLNEEAAAAAESKLESRLQETAVCESPTMKKSKRLSQNAETLNEFIKNTPSKPQKSGEANNRGDSDDNGDCAPLLETTEVNPCATKSQKDSFVAAYSKNVDLDASRNNLGSLTKLDAFGHTEIANFEEEEESEDAVREEFNRKMSLEPMKLAGDDATSENVHGAQTYPTLISREPSLGSRNSGRSSRSDKGISNTTNTTSSSSSSSSSSSTSGDNSDLKRNRSQDHGASAAIHGSSAAGGGASDFCAHDDVDGNNPNSADNAFTRSSGLSLSRSSAPPLIQLSSSNVLTASKPQSASSSNLTSMSGSLSRTGDLSSTSALGSKGGKHASEDNMSIASTSFTVSSMGSSALTSTTASSVAASANNAPNSSGFENWDRKVARLRTASPYGRDQSWNLMSVIIKSDADLRQEQFAYQLVRIMRRIWAEAGVDCWVYPYRVMVTGPANGIIETVRNAVSLHSLKKDALARKETFSLRDYFERTFGPKDTVEFATARENFVVSLAGYSVLTYVLNVKDRHNGNIMIDCTTGHLIHIDFGFMLSNSPGKVAFETAPFKMPYEYLDLLDGYDSEVFHEFKDLMVRGFMALRKEHERLLGLVEIMEKDSPMSCFSRSSLPTSESLPNIVVQNSDTISPSVASMQSSNLGTTTLVGTPQGAGAGVGAGAGAPSAIAGAAPPGVNSQATISRSSSAGNATTSAPGGQQQQQQQQQTSLVNPQLTSTTTSLVSSFFMLSPRSLIERATGPSTKASDSGSGVLPPGNSAAARHSAEKNHPGTSDLSGSEDALLNTTASSAAAGGGGSSVGTGSNGGGSQNSLNLSSGYNIASGGGGGGGQHNPPQQYPVTNAMRERLMLGISDSEVFVNVEKLITSSLGNVFTRLYDSFQYYTQGVIA